MNALLQLEQLDVSYGAVQVLHDVSLEVRTGEIVAVVGANGVGKTTLLRSVSGIVSPTDGDIRFKGRSIVGLGPEQIVRLGISHVPERRELFSTMTVLENLELGAYHRRRRETNAPIREDLDTVWEIFPILRSRQEQVAGTLSGGEQQMLAVARGLMAHSELLLLDEPSLGLAPLLVEEVLRIVGELRGMGRTVLLVEQNATGAFRIADRAYVMEVGRIVMSGRTSELLKEDRVRRAYLGQRIAPVRRPHKVQVSSNHEQTSKRRTRRPGRTEKEKRMMRTKVFPTPGLSYTLPDEYFEERVSLTRDEVQAIQDQTLPVAFAYAFEHSPFYRAKFGEAGLTPDSVRGLRDLGRLPLTTTEEVRPNPARGREISQIMAVARDDVTAIHRSSGTTGAPKIFPYTGRDIAQWAANVATVNWITGLRKGDVVLGPGLSREFTGSGGGYVGFIALGAGYIPITIGPGVSQTIVAHLTGRMKLNGEEVMLDPLLRANAIKCLASFLPRLVELLDEFDVRPDDLLLTKIGCGAEPSSDAVRTRVAERFGIWPRDDYGLGEFYGPGVAGECDAGGCLHVLSDTFIAEVLDPDTGEPTPEGEIGELVLTSLHKEALPLFRYRTGDRVMALPQNCPCGMSHARIGRVTGRIRTDDIVLPGGTVVNRTYLEEVLLPVDGAGCEYAVTVAEHPRRAGLQRLYIAVEGDGDPKLTETIAHRFQLEYRYVPVIHVLPKGTIPRPWGKARRIYSPDEYRSLVETYADLERE
jgi:branched-chain amino acid transport system ATP-binding protein